MGVATRAPRVRTPSPRQRSTVKCGVCYAKVCLSVPLCVTLVSHATVQDIEICFAAHDRGRFLVAGDQICNTEFMACRRNDCVKQRHPLATAKIGPVIHHISETCKIERKLLLFAHRKSHRPMWFPLSTKIGDLE